MNAPVNNLRLGDLRAMPIGEHIHTLFRLPERKYAAWQRNIRTAFERARTVKPGKPTYRLALGEER